METGREVAGDPTPYTLHCVAVDPAGSRVAFGDSAGIVSVVDVHGLEGCGGEGAPLQSVSAMTSRE